MSYQDELEMMDLDIDFEPEWMKKMGRVGKALCFVPVLVYQVISLGIVSLLIKLHD